MQVLYGINNGTLRGYWVCLPNQTGEIAWLPLHNKGFIYRNVIKIENKSPFNHFASFSCMRFIRSMQVHVFACLEMLELAALCVDAFY